MRRETGGTSAPRDAPKAQLCHEFFLGLYRSSAEPMPHEHYMIQGSVDKNIEIEEDFVFRRSEVPDDDATDVWNPDRPLTDDLAAFLGPDVGVARRYLPHGTLTALYWLMVAQQSSESGSEQDISVWSTFHRIWATVWHHYLNFREKNSMRIAAIVLDGASFWHGVLVFRRGWTLLESGGFICEQLTTIE